MVTNMGEDSGILKKNPIRSEKDSFQLRVKGYGEPFS